MTYNKIIIYSVTETENCYILNSQMSVPKERGNKEYDAIMKWAAEGNTPEIYTEPENTYSELRAAEYPSIAEQMDMLYWDMKKGTAVWQETIASIKEKYPKPEA